MAFRIQESKIDQWFRSFWSVLNLTDNYNCFVISKNASSNRSGRGSNITDKHGTCNAISLEITFRTLLDRVTGNRIKSHQEVVRTSLRICVPCTKLIFFFFLLANLVWKTKGWKLHGDDFSGSVECFYAVQICIVCFKDKFNVPLSLPNKSLFSKFCVTEKWYNEGTDRLTLCHSQRKDTGSWAKVRHHS